MADALPGGAGLTKTVAFRLVQNGGFDKFQEIGIRFLVPQRGLQVDLSV